MSEQNNKVEVEIFNQHFTLYSEIEEKSRIIKLANMVDERMRNIYKNTKLSSAIKIAILTALNLADELSLATEKGLKKETPPPSSQTSPSSLGLSLSQRVLAIAQQMEELIQEVIRE